MLDEKQYDLLLKKSLNISGLVRDLIDDYLSDNKITIGVSEETRNLYERIISNTGSTDKDIEKYFRESLNHLLRDKISDMQKFRDSVFGDDG